MTARTVDRDDTADSYVLRADDEVLSHADFIRTGTPEAPVLVFHHTFTIPRHRGNGYAEELVAAALDDVRERGERIRASCWFVADFVRDHPDYQDLLAG